MNVLCENEDQRFENVFLFFLLILFNYEGKKIKRLSSEKKSQGN